MKKFTSFLFTILICIQAFSQDRPTPALSELAEISILTCTPGDELYSLFGHSAIRVFDPISEIDVVYNYGTFSFNEDFYFNFAMGRLNYKLGVSTFGNFMREYEYENRGVVEQVLFLELPQKQAILNFLDWNQQPENRVYLYDFFYDNCSSIIRDVLDSTLYGGVTYADLSEADNPSFRNLIDRNLIYHPWGDFGIDLGLGMPCDKKPTYLEYMFLPDKLNEALDEAEFRGRPLVKVERTILEGKPLELNRSMTDPLPLFWILFGVIATLSAWGYRKGKRQIALDYTLLTFYGLVGALLFFLWFITDHTATSNNLNVLWAWPIHLLALPFLHIQKFRKLYFTAYTGVLVVTLLTFPLLPQMLHIATIPLMLTMVVRGFINWKLDQLLPRFKSISEQPPKKIGF